MTSDEKESHLKMLQNFDFVKITKKHFEIFDKSCTNDQKTQMKHANRLSQVDFFNPIF